MQPRRKHLREQLRQRRIKRDGGVFCAGCLKLCETPGRFGQTLHPWIADHRIPLWDGGLDDLSNLQPLCYPCDRDKTDREARIRRQRHTLRPMAKAYVA
jgi:5-methylcytosine-specific restriction endonuclease McrA